MKKDFSKYLFLDFLSYLVIRINILRTLNEKLM